MRRLQHVSTGEGGQEELGRHTLEEVCLQTACDSSGKKSLSGSGRAVQQNTLGRLDAYSEEEFGVLQGQLDDLTQLSDLLVQATNTSEVDLARVFE